MFDLFFSIYYGGDFRRIIDITLFLIGYFLTQYNFHIYPSLPSTCSLLPESARWLIVKGRHSEADVIIQRAAKVNGKDVTSVRSSDGVTLDGKSSFSLRMLVKYPVVFLRVLIVCYIW